MGCSNVANIRIEPVDVTWQGPEVDCFDFSGVTAEGLGGKYVLMSNVAGVTFKVWFDENSTDAEPTVSDTTAVAVDYGAGALAGAIAAAFATAVNDNASFKAYISGNVVKVERVVDGEVTATDASDAAELAHHVIQTGKNVYLGILQSDVEAAFEETTLELTGHQTGTTLLADLRQGVSATVSVTLQESDNAKRKTLLTGSAGGTFTPGGGTEVFGWGNLKQGLSTIQDACKLVFHPVALASSDRTRDLVFWKSYPLIESLVFSGENPETMSVSFKAYIDQDRPKGVNLFAFGDWQQEVTVLTAAAAPPGP